MTSGGVARGSGAAGRQVAAMSQPHPGHFVDDTGADLRLGVVRPHGLACPTMLSDVGRQECAGQPAAYSGSLPSPGPSTTFASHKWPRGHPSPEGTMTEVLAVADLFQDVDGTCRDIHLQGSDDGGGEDIVGTAAENGLIESVRMVLTEGCREPIGKNTLTMALT